MAEKIQVCIIGSGNWWVGFEDSLSKSSFLSCAFPYLIRKEQTAEEQNLCITNCYVPLPLTRGSITSFHWHFLCFFLRGSAIAKIVGANATKFPEFDDRVTMFVYEEMIEGKKLTEIINTTHENVKYLPGHQLPKNVVSSCPLLLFCYVNSLLQSQCFSFTHDAMRSSFTLKIVWKKK